MRVFAGIIVSGCLLATPSVGAVPWGYTALDVALGDGVFAHRIPRWRGRWPNSFSWRLEGLVPPPNMTSSRPHMFAVGPGGRIFAAIDGGMLYTDDRGQSWTAAFWDGSQQPRSMAFDPVTGMGVAVGTNGSVWASHDRGAQWDLQREGGDVLVDVAVLDQTLVWITASGLAQVSPDLGHTVQNVAVPSSGAMPTLTSGQGAAWVFFGAQGWRIRPAALVDRVDERSLR